MKGCCGILHPGHCSVCLESVSYLSDWQVGSCAVRHHCARSPLCKHHRAASHRSVGNPTASLQTGKSPNPLERADPWMISPLHHKIESARGTKLSKCQQLFETDKKLTTGFTMSFSFPWSNLVKVWAAAIEDVWETNIVPVSPLIEINRVIDKKKKDCKHIVKHNNVHVNCTLVYWWVTWVSANLIFLMDDFVLARRLISMQRDSNINPCGKISLC